MAEAEGEDVAVGEAEGAGEAVTSGEAVAAAVEDELRLEDPLRSEVVSGPLPSAGEVLSWFSDVVCSVRAGGCS